MPRRDQRSRDHQPELGVVGRPGQSRHRGIDQWTRRFRDGLEDLAIQRAKPLADLPDTA
jgi:hypothetical protein